jgi:hypothetical protein
VALPRGRYRRLEVLGDEVKGLALTQRRQDAIRLVWNEMTGERPSL